MSRTPKNKQNKKPLVIEEQKEEIQEESPEIEEEDTEEEVEQIQGVSGNYALFYSAVAAAISNGGPFPISNDDALLVASIIDQARTIGSHV